MPKITARNKALAAQIGTKLSQLQRITEGKIGTSIDTIEWLALALGVAPHQLLIPNFAASIEPFPASAFGLPEEPGTDSLQRRHD